MPDAEHPVRRDTIRRTDTSNPHRSRSRALRLLFQADLRGVDARELLEEAAADRSVTGLLDEVDGEREDDGELETARRLRSVGPIDGFTRTLVIGVVNQRSDLDARITRFSRSWQVARMPVVDRTVLRLATFELLQQDTPAAVVIDEAVEFAKDLSTGDSGRFVNGVLEAIRRDLEASDLEASGMVPDDDTPTL
ncbi:MAG: transcription antitermination factor NusB [Nitriliruptoraceae bacterium]